MFGMMYMEHERKDDYVVFMNGRIHTMDERSNVVDTIAIDEGRVVEAGGRSVIDRHKGARTIDLHGHVVLPGLIDSHNHLSFAAMLPRCSDLTGLGQKECVISALRHQADVQDGWVIGFPWRDADEGGVPLTASDLDQVSRDRPVLLIHWTFHKALANTAALQAVGYSEASDDPHFGRLVRDADGRLTGSVWERAVIPLLAAALKTEPTELATLIEQRGRSLLPLGITSIQDTGVTPLANEAYRLLRSKGRLPVSVLMMPHGQALMDNDIRPALEGPRTGTGDEMLRVGPVKLFADGGLNGTIAYAGKIGDKDYSTGMFRTDFQQPLMDATRKGFRVCVHSIGNVTTDAVLSAFEEAVPEAPEGFEMRPRIEHMFLLSDRQISRLHALNGCASVQPFCIGNAQRYRQSPFEGHHWLPYRSLQEGGVPFSASSDDPGMGSMMFTDPLKCAAMGAQMSTPSSPFYFPEQALPFLDWLNKYTAAAAHVGGLEAERGRLVPGLVADLVVLDGELTPDHLPMVAETWKDGRQVFVRGPNA